MPVVQMQSPGAKNLGGKVELSIPIVDHRAPQEAPRPIVHLAGHLLGYLEKDGIARKGQLEVALVIQRHGRYLTQSVFAIEHPAVGS